MKLSIRQKAAKKAAKTRAANRYMMERWRKIEEPANRRMDFLLNLLLAQSHTGIALRWNPLTDTGHKLKHGVQYGKLVGFKNGGRIITVLPDGYKQAKDWHPAFWEVLR